MINMKRLLFTISLLLSIAFMLSGQPSDSFVSSSVMDASKDAKYLKDFRIELGKTSEQNELRYRTNVSLWKNTRYRFTVYNAEDSKGQLYLTLKDETDRVILTSYDSETGKAYQFVEFICNRSGIYQLNYDFINGQQGSGVGIISIVK